MPKDATPEQVKTPEPAPKSDSSKAQPKVKTPEQKVFELVSRTTGLGRTAVENIIADLSEDNKAAIVSAYDSGKKQEAGKLITGFIDAITDKKTKESKPVQPK
jgi:hypothetical protein